MSWSVSFFGKPEKVEEALEAYATRLSGQSLVEYQSALPNLVGIVRQNFGNDNQLIRINASGYGSASGNLDTGITQINRSISVAVESVYGLLV